MPLLCSLDSLFLLTIELPLQPSRPPYRCNFGNKIEEESPDTVVRHSG